MFLFDCIFHLYMSVLLCYIVVGDFHYFPSIVILMWTISVYNNFAVFYSILLYLYCSEHTNDVLYLFSYKVMLFDILKLHIFVSCLFLCLFILLHFLASTWCFITVYTGSWCFATFENTFVIFFVLFYYKIVLFRCYSNI